MRILLTLLAVLFSATMVANAATPADPEASFALTPLHYDPSLRATKSYFVTVARPGTEIENGVRVTNSGTATGTAYLYPVDATTGETSGAVYLNRQSPRRDVGAWIELSASSVRLAPGQSRLVRFVVHIPRGTRPGDHLGGIVAENARLQSATGGGALQIKIRHLSIVAVEVQVPGPAHAGLVVGGVSPGGEHGYQFVYVKLRNTGSLAIKPTGTLVLRTAAGRSIVARRLQLDTFLPGTSIDYPVLLPGRVLRPGNYRASVSLSYQPIALGYRREAGTTTSVENRFAFSVTSSQQTTVYQGAAPVTRPQPAARPEGSETAPSRTALVLLAALAAAVAGGYLGLRRWGSRV